jgi:inosose dehydratase
MLDNPVSCHLITWGGDYKTGLREAASLGFRACETFTGQALEYEGRLDEFRELLAVSGLRLSALYGGGRFSDPARRAEVVAYNIRVARFLAALGVDRIVFGPAGPRTPGGTPDEELRQAARTIDEAARACCDLGVLACVHPHLDTEIEAERDIDAIMDLTDPRYVYFCPDTAHVTAAGMDAAAVIRRYGDRMRYMHIKDLRAGVVEERKGERPAAATGTERLPIFCELGRGVIDYGPIMSALQEVGYQDWITVEIDSSTSTPLESLRICRDYLQDRLGLRLDARSV